MLTSSPSISIKVKAAYAAPAFALAAMGIPVYVYVPKFYTDHMGVSISVVGIVLLAVRIFDAVTDPLIGIISDHTRSGMGRRRPYIAIGALFTSIAMLCLFNPPTLLPAGATWWFGMTLFALFFFWTLTIVPYESLGAELIHDYHERTTLFAMRDGALVAGTMVAAAAPQLIAWWKPHLEAISTARLQLLVMSVSFATLMVVFSWLCVWLVRERDMVRVVENKSTLKQLRVILANRPFMVLLTSYTIGAVGNNLPGALILYYVEYVLLSDQAGLFLFIYFVTGIVFLPLWTHLSRRIGKKRAWLLSMGINTGAFTGVFFLGAGDTQAYTFLVFLSGIGFGAGIVLPSSMQADVIDYDEALTGKRREGVYIGIWSVAKKLAAAVGVGIGLTLLGQAGYQPGVPQTPHVVMLLKVLYALVPCICSILAILIALAYPLDEKSHQALRQRIMRKRAADVPA